MPRPIWNNDTEYEFTKKLNADGWVWEFVRRNQKYADAWNEFKRDSQKFQEKYGNNWAKHPETMFYDPPKRPGESYSDWAVRIAGSRIADSVNMTWERHFAKDWRLKSGRMWNPENSFLEHKKRVEFIKDSFFPEHLLDPCHIKLYLQDDPELPDISEFEISPFHELQKDKAIFVFDLNGPIKKQVKKANTELVKNAKRLKLHGKGHHNTGTIELKSYLRVLDADCVGIPMGDIGLGLKLAEDNEYPDYPARRRAEEQKQAASLLLKNPFKILSYSKLFPN